MVVKQFLFAASLLVMFIVFGYTLHHLFKVFKLTNSGYPIRHIYKRIRLTLQVAFGQTKIMRKPVIGLMHASVFWGFCIILIGSLEMVVDGLAGTERIFGRLGLLYDIIIGLGDIFALLILVRC